MDGSGRRRVGLLAGLLLLVLVAGILPAAAQSKRDVDEAQEKAQEALSRLREIEGRLEEANLRYQQINGELEDVTFRVTRLTDTIQDHEAEVRELRRRVQERAVEAYVEGGTDLLDLLLDSATVGQVLAGQEFLQRAAAQDLGDVNRLSALRADMERKKGELRQEQARLQVLRGEAAAAQADLEAAFAEADTFYREAQSEYREVRALYEQELRRRRLAALAALSGSAAGAPAGATPGFICPMNPPISFINDWGFPRSGGRTHKGTDIFAPYGHPVLAVADGRVRISNGGLGGRSVWLTADYGTAFYYAHLSGWNVSSGQRVARGQVIGFNGDSGNARGGSPHVHFQIHPGGGAPVNPYPTLVNAC